MILRFERGCNEAWRCPRHDFRLDETARFDYFSVPVVNETPTTAANVYFKTVYLCAPTHTLMQEVHLNCLHCDFSWNTLIDALRKGEVGFCWYFKYVAQNLSFRTLITFVRSSFTRELQRFLFFSLKRPVDHDPQFENTFQTSKRVEKRLDV